VLLGNLRDYGAERALRAAHVFALRFHAVRGASLAGVAKGWHDRPWRSVIVSSGRWPVVGGSTKM
jgi:hypothetical protein